MQYNTVLCSRLLLLKTDSAEKSEKHLTGLQAVQAMITYHSQTDVLKLCCGPGSGTADETTFAHTGHTKDLEKMTLENYIQLIFSPTHIKKNPKKLKFLDIVKLYIPLHISTQDQAVVY